MSRQGCLKRPRSLHPSGKFSANNGWYEYFPVSFPCLLQQSPKRIRRSRLRELIQSSSIEDDWLAHAALLATDPASRSSKAAAAACNDSSETGPKSLSQPSSRCPRAFRRARRSTCRRSASLTTLERLRFPRSCTVSISVSSTVTVILRFTILLSYHDGVAIGDAAFDCTLPRVIGLELRDPPVPIDHTHRPW
jgi:hypothetical protein